MDRLTVTARDDPFAADRRVLAMEAGRSIAEIVEAVLPGAGPGHATVLLEGREIAPDEWVTVPPAGMRLAVVARPAGGNLGRSLAIFAVVLLAAGTQQWWLTTGGSQFGAAIAAASVTSIGMLAVNSLFPPPQLSSTDFRGGQHWSIDASRNVLRPYDPIPIVLGQVRVFPPLCAQVQWSVASGNQDARLVLCWGYGPLQLSDVRLGDTPIANLQNVSHEFWDGIPGAGAPTFSLYRQVSTTTDVGIEFTQDDSAWFSRQTASDAVEAEVIFSFRGMLRTGRKTGDKINGNAWFQIETSPAGLGQWTKVVDEVVRAKTVQPFRRSWRFPVSGATDIRVRRLKSGGQSLSQGELATWLYLVNYTGQQPVTADGVAVSAFEIRATDDISGSLDRLSGVVTSIVPCWNGSEWLPAASRNPASLALHLLRSSERLQITDEEVDWTAFETWHGYCATNGLNCDLYVDWAASTDELLRIVGACGHAALMPIQGRWRPVIDQARSPVGIYTPRNTDRFAVERSVAELPHALRVQFPNAARNWVRDEIIAYADGYDASTATRYEVLELPGISDQERAWREGRRRLKELETRRDRISFTAGIDHLAVLPGDVVEVSHHLVDEALGYGRIRSTTTDGGGNVTSVDLDTSISGYLSGTSYSATVRSESGTRTYALASSSSGRTLVFATPIIPADAPAVDDLVVVGETAQASRQMIVMRITPGDGYTARLECVPYDTAVYTSLTETPPSEIITPPTVPSLAPPKILEASVVEQAAGTVRASLLLEYPANRPEDAAGIVLQWRVQGSGEEWSELRTTTTAQTVAIADLSRDETYEARIRWESVTYTAWSSLFTFSTALGAIEDDTPLIVRSDGVDETVGLTAAIESGVEKGSSYIAIETAPGKRLRVDELVRIEQPDPTRSLTVDLSRCAIDAGKNFRLSVRGELDERPEINQFLLDQDALTNAATIRVSTSPQNGDDSLLQVGRRIILRGQNDAAGNVLEGQKQQVEITSKTTISSTVVELGISPPLEADFLVSYPNSEWIEDSGAPDRTHIRVLMDVLLAVDGAVGDTLLQVSADPGTIGLGAGAWVVVHDDRLTSDVHGGGSSNPIRREVNRVRAVTSSTIELYWPLERDVKTAWKGRVTAFRPAFNVRLICPQDFRYIAPSDPNAQRQPTFELRYTIACAISRPRNDEEGAGVGTRGQLVRIEHSYGFEVDAPERIGRSDTGDAEGGDRYGIYVTHSRHGRIRDPHMVRCRHGISIWNSIGIVSTGGLFDDCLINGWDLHGGDSVGCWQIGGLFLAGPSRAPGATKQSGITIGNTYHLGGDRRSGVIGAVFIGYQDDDGGVEVRTPSADVVVDGTFVDCKHAVALRPAGNADGGTIHLPQIRMIAPPGGSEPVKDATAGSPKFSGLLPGEISVNGANLAAEYMTAGATPVLPVRRPDLALDARARQVSGAVTIAFGHGQFHDLELVGDVTGLTITGPSSARSGDLVFVYVRVRQDATGGRQWAHPANTTWPGGSPPTITTAAGKSAILQYFSYDQGANWIGLLLADDV